MSRSNHSDPTPHTGLTVSRLDEASRSSSPAPLSVSGGYATADEQITDTETETHIPPNELDNATPLSRRAASEPSFPQPLNTQPVAGPSRLPSPGPSRPPAPQPILVPPHDRKHSARDASESSDTTTPSAASPQRKKTKSKKKKRTASSGTPVTVIQLGAPEPTLLTKTPTIKIPTPTIHERRQVSGHRPFSIRTPSGDQNAIPESTRSRSPPVPPTPTTKPIMSRHSSSAGSPHTPSAYSQTPGGTPNTFRMPSPHVAASDYLMPQYPSPINMGSPYTPGRTTMARAGNDRSGLYDGGVRMNGGRMPGTDDSDVTRRASGFLTSLLSPSTATKTMTLNPPECLADRLQPTLSHAMSARSTARIKARAASWSVNVAIGVQVVLGALTTGIAASTTGRQTSITVSILGGVSTLCASFLASARGTGEPEKSNNRCKELNNFIRELEAYILDNGADKLPEEKSASENSTIVEDFRRRFEDIMRNDPTGLVGAKHLGHGSTPSYVHSYPTVMHQPIPTHMRYTSGDMSAGSHAV